MPGRRLEDGVVEHVQRDRGDRAEEEVGPTATPPLARRGGGGADRGGGHHSYLSASSTFSRDARRAGITAAPTPASTATSVKASSVGTGSENATS